MKLVFLKPTSCDPAVFLETEQKLFMNLYDERGKAVVIELIYSKNEAEGIRYLEKLQMIICHTFSGKYICVMVESVCIQSLFLKRKNCKKSKIISKRGSGQRWRYSAEKRRYSNCCMT